MTERGNRHPQSADHDGHDDPSGDTAWDAGAANLAGMSSADSAPWAMAPTGTLAPDIRQVVFIDSSVPDAEQLAKGVAPGVVAVMLSAGSDGVAQIAAWLASHGAAGLSAIDIVAHGADGIVTLGSATLDSATLGQYSSDLAAIGAALQPGGDIQLYGCDVAQDATGDAFLQQLSAATGGAHVAAASHLVGAASGGGSWNLDVNTGAIDASAPFTAAAMSAYPDELPLTTNELFAAYADNSNDTVQLVEEIGVNNSGTFTGSSTVLATNFSFPESIAVDEPTQQYFVSDQSTNEILEGSVNGGAASGIFNAGNPNNYFLNDIALDQTDGYLYYGLTDDSGATSGIYRININGSGETLIAHAGSQAFPNALSLSGNGFVFFTDFNDNGLNFGQYSQNNLDVANIANGSITVLNTPGSKLESILSQSTTVGNDTVIPFLQGIAYDAATQTLFFETTPADIGTGAQVYDPYYDIYSVPVTISGGSVSVSNDISTLYSGGANDDYAISITLDTHDNLFYIGRDLTGSDGTIYVSSMSGGGLKPVYLPSGGGVAEGIAFVSDLCFCAGTKIATPNGEVAVEHLSAGDMVLTASGAVRPIIWVGMGRQLCTRGKRTAATPVIVTKNALGPGVPRADLYITRAHSLYVDDVFIPVEFLINHRSIRWDDRALEVTIYHIELETHDVLIANGAPAESYRDDGNRWLFHNANSGWGLPPQEPCAPVLTGGPIVDAAWRRYLDMSGPRKLPPLTDDPDLHLLVDGQRVDAVRRSGQGYVFCLPAVPETVRLVSRDTVPAELGLVRDPRSLGVAVRSVTLQQGAKLALIEAEDARLSDGFHGYEPAERLRWTTGDAGLPASVFAGFTGAVEVTVQLGGSTQYPVYGEPAEAVAA